MTTTTATMEEEERKKEGEDDADCSAVVVAIEDLSSIYNHKTLTIYFDLFYSADGKSCRRRRWRRRDLLRIECETIVLCLFYSGRSAASVGTTVSEN